MFTCGLLAQKCEATAKALIAGIATQVNLDESFLDERLWDESLLDESHWHESLLYVALDCINECKIEGTTFHKEMAQCFGSHLKLQTVDFPG